MKRTPIHRTVKCNILQRDNYTCVNCGFNKLYTIEDVPKQYKINFASFIQFEMEISHNRENKIIDYIDDGDDVEKFVFNWNSPYNLEIDHILAICLGGTNIESNLRCLCSSCHRTKTNKDLATLSSMNHYQGLPFSDSEKADINKRLAGWIL